MAHGPSVIGAEAVESADRGPKGTRSGQEMRSALYDKHRPPVPANVSRRSPVGIVIKKRDNSLVNTITSSNVGRVDRAGCGPPDQPASPGRNLHAREAR